MATILDIYAAADAVGGVVLTRTLICAPVRSPSPEYQHSNFLQGMLFLLTNHCYMYANAHVWAAYRGILFTEETA